MSSASLPPERRSDGYIRRKVTHREQPVLKTANEIDAEYWTILLYYANVKEEGQKLLNTSNPAIKRKAFEVFSAFIHQARTYYDSAQQLHHRAASLNYYYCFLNLAKAAILVKTPTLYKEEFVHGLSGSGSDHNNLFDRTSRVFTGRTRGGNYNAFDQLYYAHYGVSLPNKVYLKIGTLIRYASEASYQNLLATGMYQHGLPVFFAMRVTKKDTGDLESVWPLLAVTGAWTMRRFPGFHKNFLKYFEEVEVRAAESRLMFDKLAQDHSRTTYYQAKDVYLAPAGADISDVFKESLIMLQSALGSHFYPVYYDDPHDFLITLPFRLNLQSPMCEFLAVYVIMHHLSELVRYRPQYLERFLTSKEAWVLESIIDTSAPMFLRGIVPLITGKDYLITGR